MTWNHLKILNYLDIRYSETAGWQIGRLFQLKHSTLTTTWILRVMDKVKVFNKYSYLLFYDVNDKYVCILIEISSNMQDQVFSEKRKGLILTNQYIDIYHKNSL